MGINCLWIPTPQPTESGSKLIPTVFQQKARENPPSFKNAFANGYEIPARSHSVYESCLLDVSLRPVSRFLAGPSRARTGSVRLFLSLDTASCAGSFIPEAAMLLSVYPASHCFCQSATPAYLCPKRRHL